MTVPQIPITQLQTIHSAPVKIPDLGNLWQDSQHPSLKSIGPLGKKSCYKQDNSQFIGEEVLLQA